MKPVVLLTGDEGFDAQYGGAYFMLNMKYSNLVEASGGVPLMAYDIRSVGEYAALADGLLLTGGYDIHVGWYGEIYTDPGEAAHFSATRDDMEFMLCKKFLEAKKPILGIGRGMEVLNVALGGSLCRDVEKKSYEKHTDGILHPVKVLPESKLSEIFSESESVNSYHHLAVDRLGEGLRPAAVTGNGVVEAVEHEILPVIGVSWHPERMEGAAGEKSRELCRRLYGEGWK